MLRCHEWNGFVDGTTGLTLPAGHSALASRIRPGGQPVGLDQGTASTTTLWKGDERRNEHRRLPTDGRVSHDLVTYQRNWTGRSGPSDRKGASH
ncbi:MAG: hypothetical protein WC552_09715 [Candidatus Omnitrophota bacterium]